MSGGNPVMLVRDANSNRGQRAYNRVQIEDADAVLYSDANPLPVELVNPTTEEPFPTDDIIGALATIDAVHYEIHEGDAFSAGYMVPHASPIADNGNIDLVLITSTRYCHLVAVGSFGGDFEGYLYENPTVVGGSGTLVTPVNHKRTGGAATTVVVRHSMTVNNVGTLLESSFIPGGSGGNAIGAVGAQRFEWILSLNSTYLLRLTNRAGMAQQGSIGTSWYEETDN